MGKPAPSDDRTYAIYGVDTIPEPRTLVDIFSDTVISYPNATALIGTNESLTYSELAERVEKQIERLAALGSAAERASEFGYPQAPPTCT